MTRCFACCFVLVVSVVLVACGRAAAAQPRLELEARWLRIVEPWRYDEARRFEAGWNRGAGVVASGGMVRAPVGGRVRFVGPVAGRLVATFDAEIGGAPAVVTLTGLDDVRVRAGDVVEPGDSIGRAWTVHVGAYDPRRRSRYLPVVARRDVPPAAIDDGVGALVGDALTDRLAEAISGVASVGSIEVGTPPAAGAAAIGMVGRPSAAPVPEAVVRLALPARPTRAAAGHAASAPSAASAATGPPRRSAHVGTAARPGPARTHDARPARIGDEADGPGRTGIGGLRTHLGADAPGRAGEVAIVDGGPQGGHERLGTHAWRERLVRMPDAHESAAGVAVRGRSAPDRVAVHDAVPRRDANAGSSASRNAPTTIQPPHAEAPFSVSASGSVAPVGPGAATRSRTTASVAGSAAEGERARPTRRSQPDDHVAPAVVTSALPVLLLLAVSALRVLRRRRLSTMDEAAAVHQPLPPVLPDMSTGAAARIAGAAQPPSGAWPRLGSGTRTNDLQTPPAERARSPEHA